MVELLRVTCVEKVVFWLVVMSFPTISGYFRAPNHANWTVRYPNFVSRRHQTSLEHKHPVDSASTGRRVFWDFQDGIVWEVHGEHPPHIS